MGLSIFSFIFLKVNITYEHQDELIRKLKFTYFIQANVFEPSMFIAQEPQIPVVVEIIM